MLERSSFLTSLPEFAIVTRGLVRHFNHRANSQEARAEAGVDETGAGHCAKNKATAWTGGELNTLTPR